jgi:uncharacterized RDD family membrane protein YckC
MDKTYRTFWRRLGALYVDTFLLLPIAVMLFAVASQITATASLLLLHAFGSLYGVGYSVFCHARYGQTLGKMVTRIRVIDLSGNAIGLRQAIWRDGPSILLSITTAALGADAILNGRNPFNMFDAAAALPPWLVIANLCWILAEFLTMLTNKRRRAIHDWIAGTLVVRTSGQSAIAASQPAGTRPSRYGFRMLLISLVLGIAIGAALWFGGASFIFGLAVFICLIIVAKRFVLSDRPRLADG